MGSKPRGISASRGAAVLGLSEYQTPFEVFQRIMEERQPGWNKAQGYVMPPEPDNAAIRWGLAFENAVVELAQKVQRMKILGRELFYSVNGHPDDKSFERRAGYEFANYITCHIDGFYDHGKNDEPVSLHEGKTTNARSYFRNVKDYENSKAYDMWGTPGTDHIPRRYQVQAQHQMLCTGAQEVIISVLVFPETPDKWEAMGWQLKDMKESYLIGHEEKCVYREPSKWASVLADMGYFHQYPVKANDTVQRHLAEAYREFWERHILTGTPPEPRNYEDIKRLCPEPKSTIIVPDLIERKIAEYKGITEETTRAKNRKERLKTIITKHAATHAGIEDDESKEAVIFRNSSGDKLGS